VIPRWVVILVSGLLTAAVLGGAELQGGDRHAAGGSEPAARAQAAEEVPVTANDLSAIRAQNSPALAVDPTNPRFVVLANRLDAADFGCALQLSGDGGRGWVTANPVPKLPAGAEKCYAPEIAFDRSGVLHYLFLGLRGRGNTPMGAFLTTSADRGRSFSAPRRLLGPGNYMVRMAIDPERGEQGRIHLVWLKTLSDAPTGGLPPPPNPILAAFSDDGSESFSRAVQVNDRERLRAVAPAVAVGAHGAVHVLYYDLEDDARDYQGLEGPTWDGKWSLVSTTSPDGGESFRRGVVVNNALAPPERVILINTMAPPAVAADDSGQVFAAWYDARNRDWDVFLARSSDAGRSFFKPTRLNDDRLRNRRHQYLPRLSVAPNGRLDAIFYDRRRDLDNLRNDVYYTSSTNGGRSFASNLKLTAEPSNSRSGRTYPVRSAKGLVEFGSRLALLSQDRRALAAWTDTRNAVTPPQQDVFATQVMLP
jgi:hypothetical protein